MQMNSNDLLARVTDLGQSASTLASHAIGDAVDRVSHVLPHRRTRRRWPVLSLALVAGAAAGGWYLRHRRRQESVSVATDRRPMPATAADTTAHNGRRVAVEHAAGLA